MNNNSLYDIRGTLEGGAFTDLSHEVTLRLSNYKDLLEECYLPHGLFLISAPKQTNNLPGWYMVENLGNDLDSEYLFLSASLSNKLDMFIQKGCTAHTFSEVEVMNEFKWFATRPFTDVELLWKAARELVSLTQCDVQKVFLVVNVVPLKVLHFLPKWICIHKQQ